MEHLIISERIQRQIDRLLDEAEEALAQFDWEAVRQRTQAVLALDPKNDDALTYLAASERSLGITDPTETAQPPTPEHSQVLQEPKTPTSFSDGRYQVKRFLGEGGKKMVYLAQDTLLDRDVAFAAKQDSPMDLETASTLYRLGQAEAAMAENDEASEHLRQVFEFYAQVSNYTGAVAALEVPNSATLAITLLDLYPRALDWLHSDSHEAGRIQSMYGFALGLKSRDYETVRVVLDSALEIARNRGDLNLEKRTPSHYSQVNAVHFKWDECQSKARDALDLDGAEDLVSELRAHLWLVHSFLAMGNFPQTRQHIQAMETLSGKLRDRWWISCAYLARSMVSLHQGHWDDARQSTDLGLALVPSDDHQLNNVRSTVEFQTGGFESAYAYLNKVEVGGHDLDAHESSLAAFTASIGAHITGSERLFHMAETVARNVLNSTSNGPVSGLMASNALGFTSSHRGDREMAKRAVSGD